MNWAQVNKLLKPYDIHLTTVGFINHKDGTVLGHYTTTTIVGMIKSIEDIEVTRIVLGTTNPKYVKPIKTVCLLGGIILEE